MQETRVRILTKPEQHPKFANAVSVSFTEEGCFVDFGFIDPFDIRSRIEILEDESFLNAEPVGRVFMSYHTVRRLSDILGAHLSKIDFTEIQSASDDVAVNEVKDDE